jgi:hypothetical protein
MRASSPRCKTQQIREETAAELKAREDISSPTHASS